MISGFTDGGSDPLPPAPPIYLTLPPAHRGIGAHPRFLGTKASAIKPHTATRSRGRWRRLWTTFNSIPFNLLVALRPLSQLQNSDQASLFNMDRQGSALSTPGGVGFCGGQYYSTPPAPKAPGGGPKKGHLHPRVNSFTHMTPLRVGKKSLTPRNLLHQEGKWEWAKRDITPHHLSCQGATAPGSTRGMMPRA